MLFESAAGFDSMLFWVIDLGMLCGVLQSGSD